jgi:PDZ domain-containing protein
MRLRVCLVVVVLAISVHAQPASKSTPKEAPTSVTVPIALDQGRIVIDVDLQLPDGKTERVRAWVDNGTPEPSMTRRVATLMGLVVSCDTQFCSATPKVPDAAPEVAIRAMKISLSPLEKPSDKTTRPIAVPPGAALAPGMSAEINIPSSVLRLYDVFIDFPERQLTIALPGHLKFNGVKSKMVLNPNNGLIQIPGKLENKNYDFALDLGSSINFLSKELFDKFANVHPDAPHMTGAVGPFNTGDPWDPKLKLLRLDRLQFGPLFLTDVAVADLPRSQTTFAGERASSSRPGGLSSEALMNYRVGLDYAHSTVYFDIGRTVRVPDFDVVGLILHPEGDNGFTIAGVADFDGNPAVAGIDPGDRLIAVDGTPVAEFTLGETWSLLQGSPGQERKLTLERGGKQFTVAAKVQHFLGVAANDEGNRKSKKN